MGFYGYIEAESDTKESENNSMNTMKEELERVQKRLDDNLEELRKLYNAELAMRELCAYELQKCKK